MIVPILIDIHGVGAPEGTLDTETGHYVNRVLQKAYLKKFKAYGLRVPVIEKLKELKCSYISFHAYGKSLTGPILFVQTIPFDVFMKFARKQKVGSIEDRYYLGISYWTIGGSGKVPSNFFD